MMLYKDINWTILTSEERARESSLASRAAEGTKSDKELI